MAPIFRKVSSPRYADLVVHNGVARWVEVAADSSQDSSGQIHQIFQQMETMLVEIGARKSDLLEVLIYLANLDDVRILNEAWDAWIDRENPPSRACVGVQLQGSLMAEFIIQASVDSAASA